VFFFCLHSFIPCFWLTKYSTDTSFLVTFRVVFKLIHQDTSESCGWMSYIYLYPLYTPLEIRTLFCVSHIGKNQAVSI
jgi:hypothetical protein